MQQRAIPPVLSIYLDLVRFLAAVSVVLYHTWTQFFPDSKIKFPGHEAVVVFFVLSGYVIAHAASRPGVTFNIYLQHRVARIVPVAWLALALAFVLSLAKGEFPLFQTMVNLAFSGQAGFWWIEAPINPPFWSLNYEVWYYVVFAAWLYTPRKYRLLATGIAMLIAGPKILLLMPVWLMGVWLYRAMPAMNRATAACLFMVTLIVAAALCWLDVSDALRSWLYRVFPPAWHFHYSTQFLYDILLGIVVSLHFAAVAALGSVTGLLPRLERPIRYMAGFTFSLYVFHAPLGELYRPGMHPLLFYGEMAACVFVLAQLTERRVGFYRKLLVRLSARPATVPEAT
jgi:peptidoglycan/LPS O-acetylase OafA/YrhL